MTAPNITGQLDAMSGQPQPPKKEDHGARNAILALLGAGIAASLAGKRGHWGTLGAVATGMNRGMIAADTARMQGERDAEELRAKREQRERRSIMEQLEMRSQGAVPNAQRELSQVDVPTFMTPGMPRSVGIQTADPRRYESLGAGYSLDRQNTPEWRKAAARTKEEARRVIAAKAAAKARKLSLSDEEANALGSDEVAWRQFMSESRKPDSFEAFKQRRDYIVSHPIPRAGGGGGSTGSSTARRDPNLITVERQIQDTQRLLGPLDRQLAKLAASPDTDYPALRAQRAPVERQRQTIMQRLDSLSRVRDQIAGVQMGTSPAVQDHSAQGRGYGAQEFRAPNSPPGTPGAHGTGEQAAMQAEFARAAALYQKLRATPGVNPEEAQDAYNQTVEQIARKYGQVP